MEIETQTTMRDVYKKLSPEAIEMRNMIWHRYDEARDRAMKCEGPDHRRIKYDAAMMAIRDTLGQIDEFICGLHQPATNVDPGKYMDPAMFNEHFAMK